MHGPVELVYLEEVEDHSAALKREAEIKKMGHARKVKMAEEASLLESFIREQEE